MLNREKYNISTFTLFLSAQQFIYSPIAKFWFSTFVDIGTVLANQIAHTFPYKRGYFKELNGETLWEWNEKHYKDIDENSTILQRIFKDIIIKIWIILKSLLAFAMLSFVTAFVFRIGLMTSAIFLVICSK